MIYLEKNNLNELIKDGTCLVDFYAEWCGPCKMLGPVLEEVSDRIDVIKVSVVFFHPYFNYALQILYLSPC